MARPKKVQKVKEPVRIRQRKLANGNMSLYLDVYVKGVRKVESLGLYIVPESTPIDRQQNNHARQVAEKIKAERILALQNHGVRQWDKVKRSCITLVDFLKEYEQEKFGFSTSTLKGRRDLRLKIETYLKEANCPDIVLANVDVDFCRGFIDFLRYAKNAVRRDGSVISNGAAHHHQAVLNGALNKAVRDGSMEAAVAQVKGAQARAVARSFKDPDNYENLQFFYHPDHLGSSSFITNLEGEVVQHIEYVPFGEVFIEERNNVWNTPYLFNAKEFDEETGMYYYGARYYEPRISIWISVDPIYNYDPRNSENYLDGEHNGGIYNYANLNPYIYCYHRPTLYVDPNGKQGISGAIFGAFVGGFTEYASIVGSKVLFENKTFKEANMSLRWRDVLDISVSAGFGAASGLIDNGISRMTQWIAKPRNRKIVTKILETGMDMMEEALKQYIGDGEISISSMLVGTLTEVGMGNLIGEKYVKKALGEANNAVNVAERRLADLSKRRHPNAKLIHKAQEEVNNAKQFLNLIKGIDVGSETAKKTVSKGVSNKVD